MLSTRSRKEAIIVLDIGIEIHNLPVISFGSVEEDKRILHSVPGNHFAAGLLEPCEIGIAGSDDGVELVHGLAEMAHVLRVGELGYIDGGVLGEEDLLPVCGDLEGNALAVLRGRCAVCAGEAGERRVVGESVPKGRSGGVLGSGPDEGNVFGGVGGDLDGVG